MKKHANLDYLLDHLVELGIITPIQEAAMRAEASASGAGVVALMLKKGVIQPADIIRAKAAHFGAQVVNLSGMTIGDEVIACVPQHIAREYRVIPVQKHADTLAIAIADPSDLDTVDSLFHLLHTEITLMVTSEADIKAALAKYYGKRRRVK